MSAWPNRQPVRLLTITCMILSSCFIQTQADKVCKVQYLDTPIASKDGDFIIGGLFQIGRLSYTANGTVQHCSYENIDEFYIQKAVVMRKLIEEESERFRKDFNKTLGYEIYDSCMSAAVTARVTSRLVKNKKVIGVSSVDMKSLIKRSAGLTASFHIPTFVYMFNDDELMSSKDFPTVFSMIDMEIKEAEITIRFLEKMGYEYMDIWYHKFSKDMAEHIYDSYVKKVGCGRITDVTYSSHIPRIKETYNKTGGTPSRVQLILQNSFSTTKKILREMVDNLGFRDKIYIFGLSNGRLSFLDAYKEVLSTSGDNTLILPLPDLLNVQLNQTLNYLNKDWRLEEEKDYIDTLYKKMQDNKCPKKGNSKICKTTSWLPYMIGGIKLIIESLRTTLRDSEIPEDWCEMDLRSHLFSKIVDEDRTVNVDIEDNKSVAIKMFNKTINSGYNIGLYRTRQKTFQMIGRAFFDHIEVTGGDLLERISDYNRSCSHNCEPGSHRVFDLNSVHYLPCCWTCAPCPMHKYSSEMNMDVCRSCDTTMVSSKNRTSCVMVSEIYVKPDSVLFKACAPFPPIGVVLSSIIGILIYGNKHRPAIRASDPFCLLIVSISVIFGYCTSFIPLLKPSFITCTAEYCLFTGFFALLTTNLLIKCVKVYDIFAASQKFTPPRLGLLLGRIGHLTCNLVVMSVTSILLLVDIFTGGGPSWRSDRHQTQPHSDWHLMCTSVDTIQVFLPLIIPSVSFLTTLVLAFLMRRFPYNFRESLSIFFATFAALFCFIMFMSGYTFSSPDIKPILRFIVIFITSTAFLVCILVPKIKILRNPDVKKETALINSQLKRFASRSNMSTRSSRSEIRES